MVAPENGLLTNSHGWFAMAGTIAEDFLEQKATKAAKMTRQCFPAGFVGILEHQEADMDFLVRFRRILPENPFASFVSFCSNLSPESGLPPTGIDHEPQLSDRTLS